MTLSMDFQFLFEMNSQNRQFGDLYRRILEEEMTLREIISEWEYQQSLFHRRYLSLQGRMKSLGDRIQPRNSFDYNAYSLHFEPDCYSPENWIIYRKEIYKKPPASALQGISEINLDSFVEGADEMQKQWEEFVRLAQDYRNFRDTYGWALKAFGEIIGYFHVLNIISNLRHPSKFFSNSDESIQEEFVFYRGPFRFTAFIQAKNEKALWNFRSCHLTSHLETAHYSEFPKNTIFGSARNQHKSWRNDIPEPLQDEYQTFSFQDLF